MTSDYESAINDPDYLVKQIEARCAGWRDGAALEIEALRNALRAAHREMTFRQRENVARAALEESPAPKDDDNHEPPPAAARPVPYDGPCTCPDADMQSAGGLGFALLEYATPEPGTEATFRAPAAQTLRDLVPPTFDLCETCTIAARAANLATIEGRGMRYTVNLYLEAHS